MEASRPRVLARRRPRNLTHPHHDMNPKPIYLSRGDEARIRARLPAFAGQKRSRSSIAGLLAEINRAVVVNDGSLPPDVVSLESAVEVVDQESSERETYVLSLPENSDPAQNRISVFSPLGTALLGYAAGDELVWTMPGGPRRLLIRSVTPAAVVATQR